MMNKQRDVIYKRRKIRFVRRPSEV
ncbi:hypothetical protein [Bergeyella porcorum]